MSRYTEDRHGIVVGWDNIFFYWDEAENFHEFGSIFWCKPFYPPKITGLNYDIQTPAQQLLFDGLDVRPWWLKWLNTNTEGWGQPPASQEKRGRTTLFFPKVSQARLLRKKMQESLVGFPSFRQK